MIIIIIMIIAGVFSFTSSIGPRVHWTQMECCWKWTLYISWGNHKEHYPPAVPCNGRRCSRDCNGFSQTVGFKTWIYHLLSISSGLCFFFFSILCGMWNFSDQESNPSSKWKHGVLNTGPPGKSWTVLLTSLGLNSFICQVRITNLS